MDPLTDVTEAQRASYETGWVAIHRMLREGLSWSGHERDVCLLNTGEGRFADVSRLSGIDFDGDGRAVASVDWDHDGDLDLWLASRTGPRLQFLRNDFRTGNDSVAFRLRGTTANRDAIGARVELGLRSRSGPFVQVEAVRAGDGYLSQSSKEVHFGLGRETRIESVTVRWPGGTREAFEGVDAAGGHRRYELVEGSGRAVRWRSPRAEDPAPLEPTRPEPPAATERARIVLASRPPFPSLEYEADVGGRKIPLAPRAGPLLVNVWASWCAPCVAELSALSAAQGRLARHELEVLALSVDEPADRDGARELLARRAWPYDAGFASPELAQALDVLQRALLERKRPMPLPTSFLIDRNGRLAVITKGPLDVGQLEADLDLLHAAPGGWLQAAVPFEGRWLAAPEGPDLGALEDAFRAAGLEGPANEYQRMQFQRIESSPARVHYQMGIVRQGQGDVAGALDAFRTALALEPEFVDARAGLAYVLQQAGELVPALEEWSLVLRSRPRDAVALYNAALALAATGHPDAAQRYAATLDGVDPEVGARLRAELAQ